MIFSLELGTFHRCWTLEIGAPWATTMLKISLQDLVFAVFVTVGEYSPNKSSFLSLTSSAICSLCSRVRAISSTYLTF